MKDVITGILIILVSAFYMVSCGSEPSKKTTHPIELSFYTDLVSLEPDSVTCQLPMGLRNKQAGSGSSIKYGGIAVDIAFCMNPDNFEYGNSTGKIVTETGDEIHIDVSGQVLPTEKEGYDLEFKDTFRIVGGTGQFEGASGNGITDSYVNMETNRTDHVWRGKIIYVPNK